MKMQRLEFSWLFGCLLWLTCVPHTFGQVQQQQHQLRCTVINGRNGFEDPATSLAVPCKDGLQDYCKIVFLSKRDLQTICYKKCCSSSDNVSTMPATSAMVNSSPTHTTEKIQPRPTTPCGDRRQTLPKSFKGERDKARSADESGIWHTATIVIGILFAASLLSNICLMWYIWKNQSHQMLPIQEANEPDPEQGMLYEKTEEHNSQVA